MRKFIEAIIKKILHKCGIIYYRSANVPSALIFSRRKDGFEIYDSERKIVEQKRILADIRKKGFDVYDREKRIVEQEDILSDIRKKGCDVYDTGKKIIEQKSILSDIRNKGFEIYDTSIRIFKQTELIKAINDSGNEIFLKKHAHHYVPDYYGPSAHKRLDIRAIDGFYPFATEVVEQGRTLLYYDRLYMIYQSLKNIKSNVNGNAIEINFAEVGVYKGGTSGFICKVAEDLGLNSMTLYAFDTFEGHSAVDIDQNIDEASHAPSLFGDVEFSDVQNYLSQFEQVVVRQGRFQDNCGEIDNVEFHLVHMDVDLYEPTSFGLSFFHERLAEKGIIIVDDYGVSSCPGILKAVDEFLKINTNYFVINPLTEQLLLVKQ